jgi:hypothetical protein
VFPTLLQLLNSPHLTTFFQHVDVVRTIANHVSLVTSLTQYTHHTHHTKGGYRRSVFLVVETLSQRPALVRNNKDHVLRHLLPALAVLVDNNGANGANDPMDVLLTLRMIGKRECGGRGLVVAGGGWWWLVVAGGG